MLNTDALLRIKASVSGVEQVGMLAAKFGAVEKAAQSLVGRIGPLSGALGALVPAMSVGGLIALTGRSIEAADHMYDLSVRTGVSVEMLGKFDKAANMSGTSVDFVARAIGRLSKQMVAATSGFVLGQRTREETERAVESVRNGERQQTDIVKQNADARIQAVRDESDRRLGEIGRRYRDEERLLNDAWDDQADAAQRVADEQLEDQTNAIRRQFDARREAIQRDQTLEDNYRRFLLQQLEDQEDDALDVVRNAAAEQTKARRRAARDQQQAVLDALNDRRAKEEGIVRQIAEKNQQVFRNAAESQITEIKRISEESIKTLKGETGLDEISQQMAEFGMNGKEAARTFATLGVRIKDEAGKLKDPGRVFLELGDAIMAIKDPAMRTAMAIKIFGRNGQELLPMMEMGSTAIQKLKSNFSTEFAQAADGYNDKIATLGGRVGELAGKITIELLPALEKVVDGLLGFSKWFDGLDPGMQSTIINFGLIATAAGIFTATLAPVAYVISTLAPMFVALGTAIAGIGAAIAGTSLAATVAGWLGALTPFLSWMAATFLQGIVAIFSGPVGWIALATAAIVAAVVIWREPIGKFVTWLGEKLAEAPAFFLTLGDRLKEWLGGVLSWMQEQLQGPGQWLQNLLDEQINPGLEAIGDAIRSILGPVFDWFGSRWDDLKKIAANVVDFIIKAPERIGTAFRETFVSAMNAIKGVVNTVIRTVGNAINAFIQDINNKIAAINNISGRVGIRLAFIPLMQIPQFATGAYVTGPTVAQLAEAGQAEYAIPESQMARAAANYQQGRRGVDVLNSTPSSKKVAPANITLQTGPVLMLPGMDEPALPLSQAKALIAQVQALTLRQDALVEGLQSPAGRIAYGMV